MADSVCGLNMMDVLLKSDAVAHRFVIWTTIPWQHRIQSECILHSFDGINADVGYY